MKNREIESTPKTLELSPKSSLGSLLSFDELDNFFDDFLSRRWPRKPEWIVPSSLAETNLLRVDIIDHENDIEVQAALPGVSKEDIEVSVNHQTITLRTFIKEEKQEQEKTKYFRREIIRGEFQRTIPIPENVDGDKAQASFAEGILKITIPKSEKNKRKSIEIQ